MFYSFILAFQSFFRNFWLSIVSILMIFLMLFSLSIFGVLNILFNYAFTSLEEKVDLNFYLKNDLTLEQISDFKTGIENLPQVKSVSYLSAEDVFEDFKKSNQQDETIAKAIEEIEKNPFGPLLSVKLFDPSQVQEVVDYVSGSEFKDFIQDEDFFDYQSVAEVLTNFSKKLKLFLGSITLFFVLVAGLAIFNTVRLGIYARRDEIAIMRLVGAKASFIRAPFIIESCLYALIAWLINLGIFSYVLKFIDPYLTDFFGSGFVFSEYFQNFYWQFFGILGVFGLILVVFSGLVAIWRYLKI
ncbi:permease-like cell division protein FtsX [bacterium]|nr:permease-like cell division protein FtsX [bacterium]